MNGIYIKGVCNFSERQLQELLSYCKENNLHKPAVVQNECHPLLQVGVFVFLQPRTFRFLYVVRLAVHQFGGKTDFLVSISSALWLEFCWQCKTNTSHCCIFPGHLYFFMLYGWLYSSTVERQKILDIAINSKGQ